MVQNELKEVRSWPQLLKNKDANLKSKRTVHKPAISFSRYLQANMSLFWLGMLTGTLLLSYTPGSRASPSSAFMISSHSKSPSSEHTGKKREGDRQVSG